MREIPGYPNYAVSSDGRVYAKRKGKELAQVNNYAGYKCVGISNANGRKQVKVHRLVLMAFRPVEHMEALQVNHKDANKANNQLANLEWCTPKENTAHAKRLGLKDYDQQGEKNNFHKLTHENVQFIREHLGEYNNRELARMFGVTYTNISCIRNGKTWKNCRNRTE